MDFKLSQCFIIHADAAFGCWHRVTCSTNKLGSYRLFIVQFNITKRLTEQILTAHHFR
jgi:hypothetical protein